MVQPALLAKRKSKTWTLLDVLTYPACILPKDSGNGKEQLFRPQGKLKAGLNKITHLPFVCFSTLLWKQRSACQPMRKSNRLHADHHEQNYYSISSGFHCVFYKSVIWLKHSFIKCCLNLWSSLFSSLSVFYNVHVNIWKHMTFSNIWIPINNLFSLI